MIVKMRIECYYDDVDGQPMKTAIVPAFVSDGEDFTTIPESQFDAVMEKAVKQLKEELYRPKRRGPTGWEKHESIRRPKRCMR